MKIQPHVTAALALLLLCANAVAGECPDCTADHALPALIEPGKTVEFRVELPANLRALAGDGKLTPVSAAVVDIAVPPGFDPARPWPILIVSASQDPGYNSSRELMHDFMDPALAAGWVVLGADPAAPVRTVESDTTGMRYALVKSALSALVKAWPDSARWPIAFGGFSGGSKRSGVLAFLSSVDGRTPIGMFLGGCNQATPADAMDGYGKPLPAFLTVPIFLSSGNRDPIATPEQHREVAHDLVIDGFTRVRLETYKGHHGLSQGQVRMALQWFLTEQGKP
jgi:hypothetical protein